MDNQPVVPNRPVTPSNGRAQTFVRRGDPSFQTTRVYANGTTVTLGPNDPIPEFQPGDAFWEQLLVVGSAIGDVAAARAISPSIRPDPNIPQAHPSYAGGRNLTRLARIKPPVPSVYRTDYHWSNWPGYAHPGPSVDTRGPAGGSIRARDSFAAQMSAVERAERRVQASDQAGQLEGQAGKQVSRLDAINAANWGEAASFYWSQLSPAAKQRLSDARKRD